MNANRRADLRRKLGVAPVPKPPAGLAERIKSEIPKDLRFSAERDRDRFARAARFSIAVAASVVVVIASAFLALHVTESGDQRELQKPPAVVVPVRIAPPPAAPAIAPAVVPPLAQNKPREIASGVLKKQKTEIEAPAVEPEARNERAMDMAAAKVAAAPAPSAAAAANAIEFKDLPREEKIRVLKDRLAHGADRKEIIKAARDAGLKDFADELEKKKD